MLPGYVTTGYIEPSSNYLGNCSPRDSYMAPLGYIVTKDTLTWGDSGNGAVLKRRLQDGGKV